MTRLTRAWGSVGGLSSACSACSSRQSSTNVHLKALPLLPLVSVAPIDCSMEKDRAASYSALQPQRISNIKYLRRLTILHSLAQLECHLHKHVY